jgi:hypothetical protein
MYLNYLVIPVKEMHFIGTKLTAVHKTKVKITKPLCKNEQRRQNSEYSGKKTPKSEQKNQKASESKSL